MEGGGIMLEKTRDLLLAAAIFSALECALILSGAIPPIMSYSPANLVFAAAYLCIIALAGSRLVSDGALCAAKEGALIAASKIAVILAAIYFGQQSGTPVLGANIGSLSLTAFFSAVLVVNMVLGALVSVLSMEAAIFLDARGKKGKAARGKGKNRALDKAENKKKK